MQQMLMLMLRMARHTAFGTRPRPRALGRVPASTRALTNQIPRLKHAETANAADIARDL